MRSLIIVTALVALFACALSEEAQGSNTLQAFAGWVGEKKIMASINLGSFGSSGFGGVAGRDIKEGETLVRVPKDAVITLKTALEQGPFPDVRTWNSHQEVLQLFILNELLKGDQSAWKPYLDVLPRSFDHPILWNDAEIDQLDASPARETVLARRQALQQWYTNLIETTVKEHPGVLPEGFLTYERYVWSYLAVSTRAWGVNGTMAMVPLADMINHDPLARPGSFSEDGEFFEILSDRDYESGKQVYDSYGTKSNHDLLTAYGFAMTDNPANHMTLSVKLGANTLVQTIVEPLLTKLDPRYHSCKVFPNKRPDALLRVFRLSQMQFSELEYLNEALQGSPVTLENELRAYRAAIGAVQQMYAKYSTTVEQDQEVLDNPETSQRVKMATQVRMEEKQILNNLVLVLGKMWENILIEGTLPLGVPIR